MDDELDPREAARAKRRDRDHDAEARDLMRPGQGKVFKQITDSWGEKASPDQNRARKKAGRGSAGRGSPAVNAGVSAEVELKDDEDWAGPCHRARMQRPSRLEAPVLIV